MDFKVWVTQKINLNDTSTFFYQDRRVEETWNAAINNQWVDIKCKLPECGEEVIWQCEDKTTILYCLPDDKDEQFEFLIGGITNYSPITRWMTIPR